MSTSGTTTYSVTELEVITGAAAKIGVAQDSQAMSASDVAVFRRNLNMIVKQWVAQADFAPGLKMWTRRRAYLFLQDDQVVYDIGPSGDECAAEEYVPMILASSAGVGVSTIEAQDVTGAADDMRIGVLLASGAIQWTTITSIAGVFITVADALTDSADAGAVVFAYTSKPAKPFEIVSGVMRDSDSNDTPFDVNLSLNEYELLPSKSGEGTPSSLYAEARKDAMRVYLDRSPDDLTKVLRLVFYSYIEDSTAQTDDVDLPGEWFRALVGQLAMDSALDFSRPVTPELKQFRDEALRMAQNAHPSKSTAYFLSDPDSYE